VNTLHHSSRERRSAVPGRRRIHYSGTDACADLGQRNALYDKRGGRQQAMRRIANGLKRAVKSRAALYAGAR
jgi:hypothetical protein